MSAVEARVQLDNRTKLRFHRESMSLGHGEWITFPPEQIGPGEKPEWRSDSNGFLTGTEGKVVYVSEDDPFVKLEVYWMLPFSGSSAQSATNDHPGSFSSGIRSGVKYFYAHIEPV